MGYRVLLIAVSGKETETVHVDYGVAPTGQYEEIAESAVTGADLPGGGYLLYVNDHITPNDNVFGKLSTNASLLACYANETVMDSYLASWVAGAEQWSVWHDAQQSLTHLEINGPVPNQLTAIRERLTAEQDGVTDTDFIFDIPIELFVALGGIRYNEDIPGAGTSPWQVLDRIKTKSSWWPFTKKGRRTKP